MAGDPYWNNVVLAMHMDEVGLSDLKGHAVTLNGNAARSATQSKFGGYSAYFDGTGDYLSLADSEEWNFGAGDFTIEAWVYLNSPGAVAARVICGQQTGSVATSSFVFYFSVSGSAYTGLVLKVSNGATEAYPSASYSFSAGTLYHVAVSRASGVVRFFVNGAKVGSDISNTYAFPNSTADLRIGNWNGQTFDDTGYIDDLRITKGVARYTADFAVPTAAFPNTPPQLSGTVKDSSGNFAARVVRSHRRSDGVIGGSTTSSASDGSFSLAAYDGSVHYVICLDDDLNENALILDNITPV